MSLSGHTCGFVLVALLAASCSRTESSAGRTSEAATSDATTKNGYVARVANDDFALSADEKRALLVLARASVETYVRTGQHLTVDPELGRKHPSLEQERACFVTLRVGGELRGCIGSLEPRRSLIDDVRFNAVSAAVHDTRFSPVSEAELSTLRYEISVLDLPKALTGVEVAQIPSFLARTKPGLIIEYLGRRSTFLPSVWEDLPDPQDFLSRLCRKQGSPGQCWRDPRAKLSTYGSIHFSEDELR